MKKLIIIYFIISLIASFSISNEIAGAVQHNGHTFYVGGSGPGNYSNIQDAIDNTSYGDTVFVFQGIYYENIIVYTSIKLLGEHKTTTIIDGDKKGDVVRITADEVTLSHFTIINGGRPFFSFKEGGGIRLDPSSNSTISHNIIKNNDFFGILSIEDSSSHNIISDNLISDNGRSDYKKRSYFNIALIHSPYNTISNNIIENALGIGLSFCYWSLNTTVCRNIIRNNKMGGIRSRHCFGNSIYENTIEYNSLFGIRIVNESADNLIKRNTFYHNTPVDAFFTLSDPSSSNSWDGNYWSRSRLLPKIIPGFLRFTMDSYLGIPWLAIDWHPAQEPYESS
jgi:parallel beta-helix repeat protein